MRNLNVGMLVDGKLVVKVERLAGGGSTVGFVDGSMEMYPPRLAGAKPAGRW